MYGGCCRPACNAWRRVKPHRNYDCMRPRRPAVRQTFITNHDKDAHSAVGALPPVAGRPGSGTQILEVSSSSSMPGTPAHSALSDAADTFLNTDGVTFSASGAPPPGSPNLAAHRPLGPAVQGSESALMSGARSPAAAARTWGVNVDPSPPGAPLPTSAGRRPLGALAHSGGGASSPGGPVGALPTSGSVSAPVPASLLASVPSATAPVPLPTANGSSTLRPRLSVPGMNGAAPADSAAASLAPALPCLIQDGENLDQALARFKVSVGRVLGRACALSPGRPCGGIALRVANPYSYLHSYLHCCVPSVSRSLPRMTRVTLWWTHRANSAPSWTCATATGPTSAGGWRHTRKTRRR